MPCRCDEPETPNENPDLRRAADEATRAACDLINYLRGNSRGLLPETQAWIEKHDQEDIRRKRKAYEQEKENALKKLTPRERAVLGYK